METCAILAVASASTRALLTALVGVRGRGGVRVRVGVGFGVSVRVRG